MRRSSASTSSRHTGKFHTSWGEFGGFKHPDALEYETAQMVALGAKCLVGDQLHPNGAINPDTYASIAPAYARIEKLEPYLEGARQISEIAILSAEYFHPEGGRNSVCRRRRGADAAGAEAAVRRHRSERPVRRLPSADPAGRDSRRRRPRAAARPSTSAGGGKIIFTGASAIGADGRVASPRRHRVRGPAHRLQPDLPPRSARPRCRHAGDAVRHVRRGADHRRSTVPRCSPRSSAPISTGPTRISARTSTRRTIRMPPAIGARRDAARQRRLRRLPDLRHVPGHGAAALPQRRPRPYRPAAARSSVRHRSADRPVAPR